MPTGLAETRGPRAHLPRYALEIRVHPHELREALLEDAATGLLNFPKELSPKWLYDQKGSLLFDRITRLPEYYPTRREREILGRRAASIARLTCAEVLVEFGSGTSEKTRFLLNALVEGGSLRTFVPFDVSEPTLREAASAVAQEYPELSVHAVVGDFEHHLGALPRGSRRLVAFLGGTIGNFKPRARAGFLRQVAEGMNDGDALLLGTDLVKDVRRLEAAYNDSAGVTAQFNLNVLETLNRELGSHFIPSAFEHQARFDVEHRWIEMLLVSRRKQRVQLPALQATVSFEAGEWMRTEVSAKFDAAQVESELAAAGLELFEWWTDRGGDFALSLSRVRSRC